VVATVLLSMVLTIDVPASLQGLRLVFSPFLIQSHFP
jgi:hypothetical protein